MLEGYWVSAGLKFTTGDYTRYRDPDEFAALAQWLNLMLLFNRIFIVLIANQPLF